MNWLVNDISACNGSWALKVLRCKKLSYRNTSWKLKKIIIIQPTREVVGWFKSIEPPFGWGITIMVKIVEVYGEGLRYEIWDCQDTLNLRNHDLRWTLVGDTRGLEWDIVSKSTRSFVVIFLRVYECTQEAQHKQIVVENYQSIFFSKVNLVKRYYYS